MASQDPANISPVGADVEALKSLDDAIVRLATVANSCANLLDHWNPSDQSKLWTDIDSFMLNLQKLDDESRKVDEKYIVPIDVLKRVDEGSNPDAYTRAALDEIRNRNDKFRGKMAAVEVLREAIDVSLTAWDVAPPQQDLAIKEEDVMNKHG